MKKIKSYIVGAYWKEPPYESVVKMKCTKCETDIAISEWNVGKKIPICLKCTDKMLETKVGILKTDRKNVEEFVKQVVRNNAMKFKGTGG